MHWLRRPRSLLRDFLRLEAAAGACLGVATLAALALANSAAAPLYRAVLATPLGPAALRLSVLGWINDALMALFFLLAGLELKRELLGGELGTRRRAALPAIAALGGMALPALVYLGCARGAPALAPGWGIPTATDIAFALGVLAALGPRVPVSLRVFLTALATLDDLGAVVLIGVYYSGALEPLPLALAAAGAGALALMNARGVRALPAYLAVGVPLWAAVHAAGVHAALAGVAVAAAIPHG
ncbi:MAG: Na+/H+ antiporter NhaA, partial [Proteobacteria bacterium]|nr:Na+/H+ antiporter NhaA [Pseudomonadota bacterium]